LATSTVKDFAQTSAQIKQDVEALPVSEKEKVESQIAGVVEEGKDMLSTVSEDLPAVSDVIAEVLTEGGVTEGATVSSVPSVVSSPVQQVTSEYKVPVSGSGVDQKPLDPLLDLNR